MTGRAGRCVFVFPQTVTGIGCFVTRLLRWRVSISQMSQVSTPDPDAPTPAKTESTRSRYLYICVCVDDKKPMQPTQPRPDAFLYVVSAVVDGKPKPKTYIGATPDPLVRLDQHNRVIPDGAKLTGEGRPVWKIETAIGPLPNTFAVNGRTRWRKESRGVGSRVKWALAHNIDVQIVFPECRTRVSATWLNDLCIVQKPE